MKAELRAEELRIGNWIRSKDYKKEYQVAANTITEIIQRNLAGTQIHYPIPLTEEWLVKFGFEKYSPGLFRIKIHPDQNRYLETMLPSDTFWNMEVIVERRFDEPVELWIIAISFIHQLQNLYFALTGSELTPNKTDKK